MTAIQKRIGLGILLTIGIYTIAWFVLANMAEARLLRQLEAEQAHGMTITIGKHHKSGYPFALDVTLKDFALADRSGATVTVPRLILGASLADATHATVQAVRGTFITLPARADRPAILGTISEVAGDVHFGLSGLRDARLTLTGVSVEGLIPAEKPMTAQSIAVTLEKPDAEPADHAQPGMHLLANVTKLFVPAPEIPALGNTVTRLTLDAVVMGKVPQLNEASLAAWRDDGGTIEIHELSGQWNDLSFGMGGTLALDQAFQPEGSFNANIQGYDQAVDALAATHAIKGQYADLVKMGLSVLARPRGNLEIPTLQVPLTIQDRALYLARFKIMRLPEVHLF